MHVAALARRKVQILPATVRGVLGVSDVPFSGIRQVIPRRSQRFTEHPDTFVEFVVDGGRIADVVVDAVPTGIYACHERRA